MADRDGLLAVDGVTSSLQNIVASNNIFSKNKLKRVGGSKQREVNCVLQSRSERSSSKSSDQRTNLAASQILHNKKLQ